MNKVDVICPCYWTHLGLFESNLQSWLEEFPIKSVFLGIGRKELFPFFRKLKEQYPNVKLIDQTKWDTQGICIAELMQQVDTKWFLYLHDDVKPTPYLYNILNHYLQEENGIVESEHLHWNGSFIKQENGTKSPKYKYMNFYHQERAFSGLQFFQKHAIEPILEVIEDDYIQRNEDLIFQAECLQNGYNYVKTWGFHFHQCNVDRPWTFKELTTKEMHWKGLVKYTNPQPISVNHCIHAIRELHRRNELTLREVLDFCTTHNPKWFDIIIDTWDNQSALNTLLHTLKEKRYHD
jgi:hypothetical protein